MDSATTAYVNAMTVTPSAARQVVIDNLIVGLKSDGIWAKLDKLFLLAAHDNQAARVNAIDPTKVAIVNGTPTFTVDGGYAGDGTATSYLDFAGPFSFGGNFSQNSATIGCFITVQGNTGNHRIMGDSATISLLSARTDGSGEAAFVNSATSGRTLPHLGTTKVGHRTVVRTSASANSIYFNGSLQGTNTNGSVTPSAVNGTLLQVGGQGGSTDTVSFAYSGGALTATDVSNLDARLNTYLNSLGTIYSVAAASFAETSVPSRIRALAASSATIAFIQTAIISASHAGSNFISSVAIQWRETANIGRLRQLSSAADAQVFAETATLGRIRNVAASAITAFGESSALARLRAFGSSVATVWSESSSFAQIKLFAASVVAATWSETSSAVQRVRAFVATAAEAWSEASRPSRLRGISATGQQAFAETSTFGRFRGVTAQAPAQFAETSALFRRRSFGASATAVFSETATFGGAPLYPPVTTPSNRHLSGLVTARRIDGSLSSRRIAPNLQPRRAAH